MSRPALSLARAVFSQHAQRSALDDAEVRLKLCSQGAASAEAPAQLLVETFRGAEDPLLEASPARGTIEALLEVIAHPTGDVPRLGAQLEVERHSDEEAPGRRAPDTLRDGDKKPRLCPQAVPHTLRTAIGRNEVGGGSGSLGLSCASLAKTVFFVIRQKYE